MKEKERVGERRGEDTCNLFNVHSTESNNGYKNL